MRVVRVVCAIIEGPKRQCFLAARRSVGSARGGLWEFPGGKIEPDETPQEALRRELREELGVDVEIRTALRPSVHEYDDIAIELMPFCCVITDGELQPAEHDEIRWVTGDDALELDWAEADLPVLNHYLGRGKGHL